MNDDKINPYLWDKSGDADPEIARLEGLLGRYRHAQPLRPLPQSAKFHVRWRIWAPVLALALCAVVAVIVSSVRMRLHWQPGAPWKVEATAGAPRVGEVALAGGGELSVGEYVETDAVSSARLNIGRIGILDIQPQSRLKLVETQSGWHRVALERGTVEAHVWAPPFSFAISTPSSTAFDLGCAFTLHVEPSGYGVAHVTSGWIQFREGDLESLVPAGAEAVTRPGLGPGTAYFSDAAPVFKAALAQFDTSADDPVVRVAMLDALLASARARDALTLISLMRKVPAAQRGRLFDRLAQLIPPPPGVTRAAVIALEEPAMDAYWKALGLGNPKSWIVHWKDSFGSP